MLRSFRFVNRFADRFAVAAFLSMAGAASAQQMPHEHDHGMSMPGMSMDMAGMDSGGGEESGWYASGTSLVPRSTPMAMLRRQLRGWTLMFSGVAFGVYSDQTSPRGRDKIFAPNWFM